MEIHDLEELEKFARDFFKHLKPLKDKATVVGLHGKLGSGKTAFAAATAKILNIKDKITSPTFVIMKKYKIPGVLESTTGIPFPRTGLFRKFDTLIHIDAYRLGGGVELKNLDWIEIYKNPRNLVLVEWVEKVSDILQDDHDNIYFHFVDHKKNTREIDVHHYHQNDIW